MTDLEKAIEAIEKQQGKLKKFSMAHTEGKFPPGDAAHPQASARPERLVAVHEFMMIGVVRDHRSLKAPFLPENAGKKSL